MVKAGSTTSCSPQPHPTGHGSITELEGEQEACSDVLTAFQLANPEFYPNIHNIFRVFLTLPISTATAECSFSYLQRLKTRLCSTMTESWLSGLALMHLHQDVPLDTSKVLEEWDRHGNRRITLAFK